MPKSPESFKALDDAINRLAAESILAQAGRDDGTRDQRALTMAVRRPLVEQAGACEAREALVARPNEVGG